MPKDLPDAPGLLRQLLEQMLSERESDKGKIVHLEEENALLRQRLFGRKSEQTAGPATPQMALFNEAESVAESVDETVEEEVVAPATGLERRRLRRLAAVELHGANSKVAIDPTFKMWGSWSAYGCLK